MRRRLGRPGLIGTMARTAVIAGTASMTVNAINGRAQRQAMAQQQMAVQQDQLAEMQARMNQVQAQSTPAAPPPAAPAAPGGVDLLGQLQQLQQLKEAGALTEAEFTAAKAKLLGA